MSNAPASRVSLPSPSSNLHSSRQAVGLIGVDGEGLVNFVDGEAQRLLGSRDVDCIGRPAIHALPQPKAEPQATCTLGLPMQWQGQRGDGQWLRFQRSDSRLATGDSQVDLLTVSPCDSLDADSPLLAGLHLFRHALHGSEGFYWLLDRSNNLLTAAPGFWQAFGKDGVTGPTPLSDMLALMVPDDRQILEKFLDSETSKFGALGQIRLHFTGKEGERKVYLLRCSRLQAEDAPERYIAGAVFDVTWHQELHDELKKARDQAEAASRSKSDFLAVMSHEIRTPMNGILGMIELLIDSNLNAEQASYASVVRECGEALLVIINEILDFSKIEAGQLNLECIDFDLKMVAQRAVQISSARAHAKDLRLTIEIDQDIHPTVRGDPGRLRQVMLNLIGNAIKFTEHGAIHVTLKNDAIAHDAQTIRVEIHDTGIGIPQEKLSLLFREFTQVDSSTSRKYGGTGLGLAICRRLVALMGGEIGVRSNVGEGSVFWFTVPFPIVTVPARSDSRTHISGSRILVVESSTVDRDVFMKQLRQWGLDAQAVGFANTALNALREAADTGQPFDFALIDQNIPGIHGDQLASMIRQEPALDGTQLILTTSTGKRGDAQRMRQIGFSAYLSKPVGSQILYDCLANLAAPEAETPHLEDSDHPFFTRHSIEESRRRLSRILLCEDNAVNRQLTERLLEKAGYKVDVVVDGFEAIDAVKRQTYDLVLMDLHMPQLDGMEATRQIRALDGAAAEVPIIALTASAFEKDRDICLQNGMNAYLTKPVDRFRLFALIERFVVEGALQPIPHQDELVSETVISNLESSLGVEEMEALAQIFIDDAAQRVENLRKAVNEEDITALRGLAHDLKSTAGNFGLIALEKAAKGTEMACRQNDGDAALALARTIPELAEATLDAFSKRMLGDAANVQAVASGR